MDYEICRERHRLRSRKDWEEEDASKGWAGHNRIVRKRAFDRWFYDDLGLEESEYPAEVQKVPESWWGAF